MQRNTHTCKFFLIKNGEISEEWRRERRKRKRAKEEGEKKEHRYQKKKRRGKDDYDTFAESPDAVCNNFAADNTAKKKKKDT